jgi:hypothetical protein
VFGKSYSAALTGTGSLPLNFNITSGGLPSGLSLSGSTGVISGTPNGAATSGSVTFGCWNGVAPTTSFVWNWTLVVPPEIATATLPAATAGQPYKATLTATGTGPITWK